MNNLQNILLFLLFCALITFLVRYFLIKKNFLLDNYIYSTHKNIHKDFKIIYGPPLCGGIVIFLSFFFENSLLFLNFFIFLLLIIGVLSDANILVSPKIRILLQIIVILPFVIFFNLKVTDLRINLLNSFLQINLISTIFTVFCILVLVNGTNFIDGLNTLVLGYYIIVLLIIMFVAAKFNLQLNQNIPLFLIILALLFIFNFFQKIYLGDSGSYIVALIISFFTLEFVNANDTISPYFICLLLWYPAFENLFSIVRRLVFKKSTSNPDKKHLHQLLFFFISKKFKLIPSVANTFSAILINLFNLFIFVISFKFYAKTNQLLILLMLAILTYLFIYFLLRNLVFSRSFK
jgi:UDP-N-acetylmuramyl pentapeptide phosphotransferase/UDP-N-acetylglucosamine-1-phosphate transferase